MTDAMELPSYRDCEWRLDLLQATRASRDLAEPVYLISLSTQRGGKTEEHLVQVDYANLKAITDRLDGAAKTLNQAHVRRISRLAKSQ